MTDGLSAKEKRVFNPNPYRHYRRTYSVTEVRIGSAVVILLVSIGVWIGWRGRHPDPFLYGKPSAYLPAGSAAQPVDRSSPPRAGVPAHAPAGAPNPSNAAAAVPKADRGALPRLLAPPGWKEGTISRFTAENLYEKIDGRADYFLSRGFRSMSFVPLVNEKDSATSVDLELYDLSSPENARSAFGGERPPEIASTEKDGSAWYTARNALFLTRGAYYLRAIGSDEGPAVKAALDSVRAAVVAGLPAGERPFAHALFGDALGLPPDRISYLAENAFSFGFANGVHTATLPDGDTEVFVVPTASPAAAGALAARFEKGFLEYGEAAPQGTEMWVKDRYLGTFSRALAEGRMVVGIRGAPKRDEAEAVLAKLRKGVKALPDAAIAKAAAAAAAEAAKKVSSHE